MAVEAGNSAFQYYSSGVITANDGCGDWLDHAVAVVGYTDSGTDPEPEPYVEMDCTVTKWWHTCVPVETTDETTGARRLQDASGYDKYWKVQNSWGTWWGDDGFILFEIQDGQGVCGMNRYVEYVDMKQSWYDANMA